LGHVGHRSSLTTGTTVPTRNPYRSASSIVTASRSLRTTRRAIVVP
jgi:hypothetical protein